jgi:membrane-bound lytic murein transglycosylase A
MSRAALLALLTIASALLTGCPPPPKMEQFKPEKDYGKALPPGQMALRKIPPEQYPDFSRGFAYRAGLERAVLYSKEYLAKPSSQRYYPYLDISHARARASLDAFLDVLHTAQSPEQFDQLIRERFEVYESVGYDGNGVVFFTGYYTPIFNGRQQADSVFRYPLYRAPPDLVKGEDGAILGRRTPEGATVPYYSRREIEEGKLLEGQEIAWLKDPFETYVVTVQGSAKLRLADGSLWDLGYAGNNGLDYVSVPQKMIAEGAMKPNELSLQTMIAYFRAHADKVQYFTWMNPRYVFFQEVRGGPWGCLGVPVTTRHSVATDKAVFPRAGMAFVDTQVGYVEGDQVRQATYAAFTCDQDRGGAIRAAGKCDIYMGVGPGAEAIAGRTAAEGRLYYVFIRPELMGAGPISAGELGN